MADMEIEPSYDYDRDYTQTMAAADAIESLDVSSTNWFPCVVAVNRAFSLLLHEDAIKSFGQTMAKGIQMEARLSLG